MNLTRAQIEERMNRLPDWMLKLSRNDPTVQSMVQLYYRGYIGYRTLFESLVKVLAEQKTILETELLDMAMRHGTPRWPFVLDRQTGEVRTG